MYILKIEGKEKIPDYVQIRDDNYTLIGYFRADRPEKGIEQCGLLDHTELILSMISTIPFGKLTQILLP